MTKIFSVVLIGSSIVKPTIRRFADNNRNTVLFAQMAPLSILLNTCYYRDIRVDKYVLTTLIRCVVSAATVIPTDR